MTPTEKAISRLQFIIEKGFTHIDYDYVVEYAEKMRRLVTGNEIEKELKQFVTREDEQLFNQRKILSQIITPSICNTIISPSYKISRAKPIVDDIEVATVADNDTNTTLSDEQQKVTSANIKKIRKGVSDFYGGVGVDKYIEQQVMQQIYIDPNAWNVVMYDKYDNRFEKPKPYARIIPCKDVVDYEIANNETQYMVLKRKIKYLTNFVSQNKIPSYADGNFYQMYIKDYVIQYTQVDASWHKGSNETAINTDSSMPFYEQGIKQRLWKFTNGTVYLESIYETKVGVVQAFRIGVINDAITNYRTCISPLQPAVPYLMKSIKAVSELDISISLHVFLQKIAFQPPCTGESSTVTCNRGKTPDGKDCKVCGGTGYIVHKSSQDTINLAMPVDKEDAFDLSKMVYYVDLPIAIVEFLDKFCDKISEQAIRAVFNSDTFIKPTFTDTATGQNINMQSVYDALYPIKTGYENIRTHITKCIAGMFDVRDVVIVFQFPRDFKMRSIEDLLLQLAKANESGASQYIRQEINNDISELMYIDRPDDLKRIKVKQRFNPFEGKGESEIIGILNDQLTPYRKKVLYVNMSDIFTEAERQYPRESGKWFYDLEESKQKQTIDSIIDGIIEQIQEEADLAAPVFINQPSIPPDAQPQGLNDTSQQSPDGQQQQTPTADAVQQDSQAKLKGTVGGVQGILEIQRSVSEGTTELESGIIMLVEIYGFDEAVARKIIGKPKPKQIQVAEVKKAEVNPSSVKQSNQQQQ